MAKDNKKLQQEWARKLARSGFEDIERPNGSLKNEFRVNDPSRPSYDPHVFDARRRYYEVALHLVEEEREYHEARGSRLPKDWRIRALHTDGLPYRRIQAQLRVSYTRVFLVVQAFAQLIREEILK